MRFPEVSTQFLKLYECGFIDSALVTWSGNPLGAIFVSSTQLKAAITPDLRASSGKFNLTRNEVLALNAAGQQTALISTYINSATLTAVIPADALAVARAATIQVVSLDGSSSGSLPFGIRATPVISSVSPNPIDAAGPFFLLTVTGTGFAFDSVVKWSGARLDATFVRLNDTSGGAHARVESRLQHI